MADKYGFFVLWATFIGSQQNIAQSMKGNINFSAKHFFRPIIFGSKKIQLQIKIAAAAATEALAAGPISRRAGAPAAAAAAKIFKKKRKIVKFGGKLYVSVGYIRMHHIYNWN